MSEYRSTTKKSVRGEQESNRPRRRDEENRGSEVPRSLNATRSSTAHTGQPAPTTNTEIVSAVQSTRSRQPGSVGLEVLCSNFTEIPFDDFVKCGLFVQYYPDILRLNPKALERDYMTAYRQGKDQYAERCIQRMLILEECQQQKLSAKSASAFITNLQRHGETYKSLKKDHDMICSTLWRRKGAAVQPPPPPGAEYQPHPDRDESYGVSSLDSEPQPIRPTTGRSELYEHRNVASPNPDSTPGFAPRSQSMSIPVAQQQRANQPSMYANLTNTSTMSSSAPTRDLPQSRMASSTMYTSPSSYQYAGRQSTSYEEFAGRDPRTSLSSVTEGIEGLDLNPAFTSGYGNPSARDQRSQPAPNLYRTSSTPSATTMPSSAWNQRYDQPATLHQITSPPPTPMNPFQRSELEGALDDNTSYNQNIPPEMSYSQNQLLQPSPLTMRDPNTRHPHQQVQTPYQRIMTSPHQQSPMEAGQRLTSSADNLSGTGLRLVNDTLTVAEGSLVEIGSSNTIPARDFGVPPHGKRFFKVGKVFKITWYAPAGRNRQGNVNFESKPYKLKNGLYVHVKEQLMLVIQCKEAYSICCPISTYGGQGMSKLGLKQSDVRSHAIIYSEGETPTLLSNEPRMGKEPIPVRMDTGQGPLDRASRIHFGQTHTVQHNVPVMAIGEVVNKHHEKIKGYLMRELGF